MIRSIALGATLIAIVWQPAMAATCEDLGYERWLRGSSAANSINSSLSGNRIEAIAADGSGEEWNEDHCANGNLFKVGAGPLDPVDPRAFRGVWSLVGNNDNSVRYRYTVGGDLTYRWRVYRDDDGSTVNGTNALCWQQRPNEGGQAIATAPAPSEIPSGLPCSP